MVALLLIGPIVGGLVGFAIGQSKGRGALGFLLGCFLGFIGWIIMACTSPTDEYQARQAAILTSALAQVTPPPAAAPQVATRICPYCAEDIKAAATVCRFCGRDVEPLSSFELEALRASVDESDLARVAADHPGSYPRARPYLDALSPPPDHPAAWLRELCVRIDAGSPPDRAAARIPLDLALEPAAVPPAVPMLAAGTARPETAGEFPRVAASFPAEYNQARSILGGLATAPNRPELWLAELCARMHNGSPPEAAGARIPLDWGADRVETPIEVPAGDSTATCGSCGAPNRGGARFCGSCGQPTAG